MHWLDVLVKQQAAHYGLTPEQFATLKDGACAYDELLTQGEADEPDQPAD